MYFISLSQFKLGFSTSLHKHYRKSRLVYNKLTTHKYNMELQGNDRWAKQDTIPKTWDIAYSQLLTVQEPNTPMLLRNDITFSLTSKQWFWHLTQDDRAEQDKTCAHKWKKLLQTKIQGEENQWRIRHWRSPVLWQSKIDRTPLVK